MKTSIKLKKISSQADLVDALIIRIRVFVQEQQVPAEIELDADDAHARHFFARVNGIAAGTARVVIHNSSAKIGRMAVLKRYRRRGIGGQLLRRAVSYAKRRGARNIYLHAQVPVIGFYERQGFITIGKVFNEAGIPHRKMILPAGVRRPKIGR